MFCPRCKDEFRAGFTRCASCNVELVDDLTAVPAELEAAARPRAVRPPPAMVDYCGFLSLEEARDARERLRAEDIRADISIRDGEAEPIEEYWLRVEASRYAAASAVLGFEASEPEGEADATSSIGRFAPKVLKPAGAGQVAEERAQGETIRCSECGEKISADEPFCPSCGLRFED
jgi:hypothetical protein